MKNLQILRIENGFFFSIFFSKLLNFISLIFTAITVKNKRKIACFGFSTKDNIGSATKGNPKLITPLTNPPKDIAKSISRIE